MLSTFYKIKQSKYYLLFLAICSGLLLWLGWPTLPTGFLLFVAFIPLLEIERVISEKQLRWPKWTLFMYTYLSMLIWNAGTTWWIWHSTMGGGVSAVVANSLLMTIPFFAFRITRRNINEKLGYVSFVTFWITFEYVHLNWDLSWPWLSLGNGFAEFPSLIQWYEYTGVLGGSLWVLIINIYAYQFLRGKKLFGAQRSIRAYVSLGFLLFVPIISSFIIKSGVEVKTGKAINVVVVQPNIDPYTDKFDASKFSSHIDLLIGLSESKIEESTDYVVWPESALQGFHDYDGLEQVVWPAMIGKPSAELEVYGRFDKFRKIRDFLNRNPHVTLLSGLSAQKIFRGDEEPHYLAHETEDFKWQSINAAMQVDTASIALYKKSKLVIGVEKIPYPVVFKPIIQSLDIQGAAHLQTQANVEVFYDRDSIGIAPAICYESVYGEYLGRFTEAGAQLIMIMTNDGWWKNTEGHRHHNSYAKLRAIELRRDIARSANTGISCFINKRGEVTQATAYGVQGVEQATLYLNDTITFYAKYGDYIGRLGVFLALMLLLSGMVKRKTA